MLQHSPLLFPRRFRKVRRGMVRLLAGVAILCFTGAIAPETRGQQVIRDRVEPQWLEGGEQFWYRLDFPGDRREFVRVDAGTGTRSPAFDHAQMAGLLSSQLGKPVEADRLPIESLEYRGANDRGAWPEVVLRDGSRMRVFADGSKLELLQPGNAAGIRLFLPPRPSAGGQNDTVLVVENRLAEPLEMLWVNPAGELVPYHSIQPGASVSQPTYEGHVWLFRYSAERPVGCVAAPRGEERVVIDNAAVERVERNPSRRESRRRRRGGAPRDAGPVRNPAGDLEAFVQSDNLALRSLADADEAQPVPAGDERPESGDEQPAAGSAGEDRVQVLTRDGTPDNSYRRDAVRARILGMQYELPDFPDQTPDVRWSPDGKYLLAFQTARVPEPVVHYIESLPADRLQPALRSYPYAKPGDPIPVPRPHLFRIADGSEIPLADDLFPRPFSLEFQRWSDDGTRAWFLYNERGHQRLRLLELELASGRFRVVIDETSETFIHYSSGGKFELHWLGNQRILWASERSGWNHLYLIDQASGEVLHPVTSGEWNVKRIEQIDEASGTVWFHAVGAIPGQDPYHEHFCRVQLDGSDFRILTPGDGTHEISWSPDRRWLIDRYSRVDLPPVTELRDSRDGRLVCLLETAAIVDQQGQPASLPLPERFVAPGRDGQTAIWGIVHRPSNFDPAKRYPVIENIYAGPHDHHVPKAFSTNYWHQRRLADAGFIVVQCDGMGTAWRSKKFHDVCWKNLRDGGFPDRIAWLRALAERYPQFDLQRVGIYGGSAGGQNAMAALLWHGDFYRAAVADCGCHDNRMDKLWWNEQWMGLPEGNHYAENSNMENAERLQGHLLLVVGELDRNVDPATTTQVTGRLIRANRDFEYLLMVGAGHGACETPYGSRRRLEFFQRHLGGPVVASAGSPGSEPASGSKPATTGESAEADGEQRPPGAK